MVFKQNNEFEQRTIYVTHSLGQQQKRGHKAHSLV